MRRIFFEDLSDVEKQEVLCRFKSIIKKDDKLDFLLTYYKSGMIQIENRTKPTYLEYRNGEYIYKEWWTPLPVTFQFRLVS